MTDNNLEERVSNTTHVRKGYDVNWTRLEGVVAVGTLLASFMWFLGMSIGMAIGFGFGIVLLLDFIRELIFGSSRNATPRPDSPALARH